MSEVQIGADMSRIRDLFLEENYLLGLGFPQGFLFFRIKRKEFFVYAYDELDSMTAAEYSTEAQLGIAGRNITNAFRIPTDPNHIYQIFRGMSPSQYKTYLGVPYTTPQHNLDVAARLASSDFGYLSGWESPLNYPAPESEVWIPYRLDIGFAQLNPINDVIYPKMKFYIMRYDAQLLRDAELVSKILDRRAACRLATVGGLVDFDYHYREYFMVDPIQLGDTKGMIQEKLQPGRQVN